MKNNGKVRDVRSHACKIKVLNGLVPGTWKWTIKFVVFLEFEIWTSPELLLYRVSEKKGNTFIHKELWFIEYF